MWEEMWTSMGAQFIKHITGEFFKKAITTKSQFWDMAVYVFSSVWGLIEAKQSKIGDCYVNINWRRYQA